MWTRTKQKIALYNKETLEVEGYCNNDFSGLFIYKNENGGRWTITHTLSGKVILNRIRSLDKAKDLVAQLSLKKNWNLPEGEIKNQEYQDCRNDIYKCYKRFKYFMEK